MLLDTRLWLLIGLSVAMLFTIEAIEEFVDGAWPQMRRPAGGWGVVGQVRPVWMAVAMAVLPGLVLTILNLALLVARDLPYSNVQILGTIFVVVGWLVFLATTTDLVGIGTYLQEVGIVAPLALVVVLLVGDLLLLVSLVDIFPHNLHSLLVH
ncbi:MAG TPA: hypothetical protein VMU89_20210 [Thermomicrobiaceae bacterium]|nr:hypothetical protein [Thermomicrobiaceae bacterium]